MQDDDWISVAEKSLVRHPQHRDRSIRLRREGFLITAHPLHGTLLSLHSLEEVRHRLEVNDFTVLVPWKEKPKEKVKAKVKTKVAAWTGWGSPSEPLLSLPATATVAQVPVVSTPSPQLVTAAPASASIPPALRPSLSAAVAPLDSSRTEHWV